MKPIRISHFIWLAALSILFSGAIWAQQPLTVTNPGFEQPTVAEGIFNQAPTSWSSYNGAAMGTDVYAYNPSLQDFNPEPTTGSNLVGVYNAINEFEKGLQQTLSTLFQEGNAYLLTVKVGYTAAFSSKPGYKVQLLAGNTVIAEDDNSLSSSMAFGQFVTSTVQYNYVPSDASLVGQQLRIRLINKGLVGLGVENEVAFDDAQLFVVQASPFANANGPYYMPNSDTFLSLNASGSLPSGLSSITLYEWDVDNDGDFDENITGLSPSAISYSDLQNKYGMVDGSNTVRLRITDSSNNTGIALATVEFVTSTKYIGPNTGNADTWNNPANWNNGLPEGDLDVVILSGRVATPWNNSTPNFFGNLTLENSAGLNIGWTTQFLGSYNALGTPGFTKIIMNSGSYISTRMGGTPVFPEIQLLGNVPISLGSSTQGGAQAQFNYPINGSFRLHLQGNNQGSCIANLNATNSFSTLLASGSEGGLTIRANASGSLGLGDVTMDLRTSTTANYAILEINAANAMADTGTLSIRGTGATLLRMNANDTIANFVVDGVTQAPGTYGSTVSAAVNKRSWISGTGILTVATPLFVYWDINGNTADAGGTSPAGTWNASNTFWNPSAAGTGSVNAWTPGHTAIFSAGTGATGAFAVDVVGSQDTAGILIRSGTVSLNPGAGGALRLTSDGNINVVSGSATIATPINQSSTRLLSKSGSGRLTLSGNLSHTGGTSLLGGNLILSGDNSAATGNTTLNGGVLQVNAASAIPGTTRNVTINSSGTLVFGSSFGSSNIQTALNNRIVTTSAGTIYADNNASANFDFSTAGLTAAFFGSLNSLSYTGTLTPQGNVYRLAGDSRTLTMANTNALTGARSLISRGKVILQAGNNYTGSTTVNSNSSLSLLGSTSSSGVTLNSGSTLIVGNNGSLGTGTLTFSGSATLKALGTVVTTNNVAANSDFIVAGVGNLTLGATTINADRIITNRSTGTTIFSSISRDLSNNRSLTFNGIGNTTVTGNLTLGTGNLTKNDSSIVILSGANAYAATTINGGTLRLEGSVSGAATTTINAATLQLVSTSNGGLASGDITFNNASAVIQAVGADRSISNRIILNSNGVFSGSQSLTVNGTLINSGGNRTLINSLSSGKALVLGAVNLSNDATSRTMTIDGSGSTVISGIIANGSTSTASSLVKSGSGTLILNNNNTYGGATTVNANGGKLFVNGTTGSGIVTIGSGATLGGTGTIGGNTTIAAGGLLEFNLSSTPASQDKLELAAGRSLTFSGASVLRVTGSPSVGTYTLLTAPGGIIGTLPTFTLPAGWIATVSRVGNDLRLNITFLENSIPTPTLASMTDDKSGGPVEINTPVVFTITFNQDMDINTISAADFSNAGTSAITFGAIAEPTPGVITLQATATTAGTLRLRINAGASLSSTTGVELNTSSALLDDTTIQAQVPNAGSLAVSSGDFSSSGFLGSPFSPLSKDYTLSNFGSQSLNWTAGKTAGWLTLSGSGGSLAPGASIIVTATINSNAAFLPISPHYDTITFTNTTNNQGNTTRGVNLTVNGLSALVTLGGLNQTYDGTPKTVSATTSPPSLAYSLTYNGLAVPPTNGGEYDVVATITDPGYTGSASGTLTISKTSQTINFAALASVGNDQNSVVLTATASSGLPVSFSSSNSNVATVSGNVVTIIDVGTTTITASQAGNENYLAATVVERVLTVTRGKPLAVPGGPYLVLSPGGTLQLNGTNSLLAASGNPITLFEWDLNSNDNGGVFNSSVTGATPAPITASTLLSTWGMLSGTNNTIRLRVTDSAAKTTTVSTTVFIRSPFVWDANATGASITDGGGQWFNANQWWNGTFNTTWVSGSDADFGNGGAGGGINLPVSTSMGSLTFNSFSGTYTLGTSPRTITINGGINMTAASSTVSFASPIILGASQTWTNLSSSTLNTGNGANLIDLGPHQLTIDGTGNMSFGVINQTTVTLKGSGGLVKSSSGRLNIGGANSQFTGNVSINNGVLMQTNDAGGLGSGNLSLNGGVLEFYWGVSYLRALGAGAGQVQIPGGVSGFSQGGSGTTIRLNNSSAFEAVWGSEFFNPSVFVINSASAGGVISFDNRIDLNGADRTVQVGASTSILSGIIRNSNVSPAGLIKTGSGTLQLNGANTFNGGTTLQQGTIQLGNTSGLGSSLGTLTVNSGLLNLNNIAAVTVGNLTGTGGTIANNGAGAITFNIGNGGGTGGNFQGVIANRTNAGTGTLALTKTGSGAITLSGANSYTGATNINQGRLLINGSTAATAITVANGATLGGTGTLGGTLTVAAGGAIAPGTIANVGTLNVNNNVTVTSGIWDIDLNASTPVIDLLNITGNLTWTGTQTLNLNVLAGTPNGTYTFGTWTGTNSALGTWNISLAGNSSNTIWLGGADLLWDNSSNWSSTPVGAVGLSGKNLQLTVNSSALGAISTANILIDPSFNVSLTGPASGGRQTVNNLTIGQGLGVRTAALTLQAGGNLNVTGAITVRSDGTLVATAAGLITPTLNVNGGSVTLGNAAGNVTTANVTSGTLTVNHVGAANLTANLSGTGSLAGSAAVSQVNVIGGTPTFTGFATSMTVNGGGITTVGGTIITFDSTTGAGTSIIGSGTTITTANVSAGTVNFNSTQNNGTLVVTGGITNIGTAARVSTANFTAGTGTVNGANPLVITNRLILAGSHVATLTGGTSFSAAGANLANNSDARTLSLSGGTLSMSAFGAGGGAVVTVTNPSFETDAGTANNFRYQVITGWTGGSGIEQGTSRTFSPAAAPNGSKWAFIQGAQTISQNITVATDGFYRVSFSHVGRSGANGPLYVQAQFNTTPATAVLIPSQTVWTNTTSNAVFLTAGSHSLRFVLTNPLGGDRSSCIDNVSVTGDSLTNIGLAATSAAATASSVLDLSRSAGTHTLASLNLTAGGTTTALSLRNGASLTLNGDPSNNAISATGTPGQAASILPDASSPPSLIIAAGKNVSVDPGVALSVQSVISGGSLTKIGDGNLTLTGSNTYSGTTTVSAGKLFINGNQASATGNVSVAANATLGGSGATGGNITIAANGKLEFNISTSAVSHDPLNVSSGKALTFSGASELTITSAGGIGLGTYVLVTGGNNISGSAPSILNMPAGTFGNLSIVGNELRLVVTSVNDSTPPTLSSANIVDDRSGGPVAVNTPVTYTVTFSEDMNASTVTSDDFDNAGTSLVNFGAVTETTPGVFTVQVSPTTAGSLILRVKQNAVLSDAAANNLNTTAAITDNTTITVGGTAPTLVASDIVDDKSGGPVAPNTLVTYAVTFSRDMNASTVTSGDFENAGTSLVTFGAIAETTPTSGIFTVQLTPTTAGSLVLRVRQNAVLSDAAGNNLNTVAAITDDTTIVVDGTAPTLVASSIVDDKSGGPVTPNTLVTYTVTFSEDMNASTITTGDFENAGTSPVTFGAITEITPGVFTVQATPTTAGSLILRVRQNAVLSDAVGNNLNTTTAITDNTTIAVDGTAPTLAASSIVDNKSGGPVSLTTLVTYTVTFNEDMNASTVTSADFENAGTSLVTFGAIVETTPGVFTVEVVPTTVGTLTLRVKQNAVLSDAAGNNLNTTTAITDDTTITVDGTAPTLGGSSIVDNKSGDPVTPNTLVTYTVTFSKDMNASTVTAADFQNAGTSAVTFGAITETTPTSGIFTVLATPTTVGTLILRVRQNAVLTDAAGNNLNTTTAITDNTTIIVENTVPTLVASSIVDDKSGAPVTVNTLVTYTVTFSEDMNASTVTTGDFENAGTSLVTFGAITEITPGVFTVQATPTTVGTLILRVRQNAVLSDVAGNNVNTTTAITDTTTITVTGSSPTLVASDIVDDKSGDPVKLNTLVTYTVTFSRDMNASTITTADFENAGTSFVTFGAITETTPTSGVFTVLATPTTAGTLILRVKQNAVLSDVAGNNINTTTAIADNTTITVDGTVPTLAASFIVDDKSGGPVTPNTLVTYTVTFSEDMNASTVTIGDFENAGTSPVTFGAVTETTPTSGIFTVQATPTTAGTLILRLRQNAVLSDAAGNNLNTVAAITDNTTITVDGTAPTLVASSIVDNKSGGPVTVNTLVTYTVTFNEDMNASSVTSGDFENAGTSLVTFGAVTEPTPGVFTVQATPTTAGTLILRVQQNAVLSDAAGNNLNTVAAIADNTTITVDGTVPTLAPTAIVDNRSGAPIRPNAMVTYTVTFSEDMNAATVTAADFENAGTSPVTFGAIAETTPTSGIFTVQVTPTTVGTLILRVRQNAVLSDAAGNNLNTTTAITDNTTITVDGTVPTLVSTAIVDNRGGATCFPNTPVTYTVTFSKDMDAATVTAADFGNAGTSAVTFGAITESTPTSGIFTVLATPTTSGTLILRVNAFAVLSDVAGNNLSTATAIADNTTIVVDGKAPSLAGGSIVDDKSGAPVRPNTLVTYTVTFSEDMNASTITIGDFENAGTSLVTFGAIAETTPTSGIFTVQVTPTTAGTLILRVRQNAVLSDAVGNNLNTLSAIADNNTITVDGTVPTLAPTAIVDNRSAAPVRPNTLVTYTVTFSEDMNASTVTSGDFDNAGTSFVTFGTITETTPGVFTVQATPITVGTLILRVKQNAVLSDAAGNNLNTVAAITDNTTITVDGTVPTLAASSIVDNKGGGSVTLNTLVTYTVSFSEDMNAATVTAADFDNAGTSLVTFGAITETTPTSGIFTVRVTPTTAGTLILRVQQNAVLSDAAGNNLNTVAAITDNTTIAVDGTAPTLVAGDIVDDKSGGSVAVSTLVTYTVTFSEDMNASTVTAADFDNAGTSLVTFGAIAETTPTSGIFTVQVTPTTVGTLILRVRQNAVLSDAAGNNLITTTAITDKTTIGVISMSAAVNRMIAVNNLVTNPYATWAAGAPFGNDTNGDGVPNALAWVLGAANPNVAADGLLPTFDEKSDPDFVTYTFRRRDGANEDPNTVISVQYVTSLTAINWATAVHDGTNVIVTETNDFFSSSPGVDRVEVKMRKSVFSSNGSLFIRLSVAPAP